MEKQKSCILKKISLTVITLLSFKFALLSQVTSVNYLIKYNDTTSKYDCYLLINSGYATTVAKRTQFNAQYTILTPSGTDLNISERFMPLQNNNTYNGTIPMEWNIGSIIRSPQSQPQNNFFSIIVSLSPTSQYNNLYSGDTIKLFSLIVNPLPQCKQEVRLFQTGVDPNSSAAGMGGADLSNGFTLGGVSQLYNANSIDNSVLNPVAAISGPTSVCPQTITTLYPPSGGTWQSLSPAIASVDNSGIVTGLMPGTSTFIFTSSTTGCRSLPTSIITVNTPPSVSITGPDTICIGQTTQVSPSFQGTWSSSNAGIAYVSNSGLVTAVSSGVVNLTYTSVLTGCHSETQNITVTGNPGATLSKNTVEINKTINLSPTTGGTWVSNNPDIVTILNNQFAQGIKKGNATLVFLSSTGCNSSNLPLTVTDPVSTIVGYAFRDMNGNGIFDSNTDSPLPNCAITIPGINMTFYTDKTGYYNIKVVPGTYSSTFMVPYGQWTSNTKNRTINANGSIAYVFVGFTPISQVPSALVTINSPPFLCNSSVGLKVSAFNNSSQVLSGYLAVNIDNKTGVSSTVPFPVGSNENQLIWAINNLLPGHTFTPEIAVDVPLPSSGNDSLYYQAYILSENSDTISTFAYSDINSCTVTNGKANSWPDREGTQHFTLRNEPLDYMIQFQNPTSSRIQKVTIQNQLDANIDLSSILVKESSHPVNVFREGNMLYFEFNDINLNGTRAETKNGFISFQAKFNSGLPDGTVIINSASINFDNIQTINTNSTINTIVTSLLYNPLPLMWKSFQVKRNLEKVNLDWEVEGESNVDSYEVEWRTDGNAFTETGNIPALSSSRTHQKYTYTHSHPGPGTNYYKIKQIDNDGRHTYSEIRSVYFIGADDLNNVIIYPNPILNVLKIRGLPVSDEAITLTIYDTKGILLKKQVIDMHNYTDINIEEFASGTYFIQIRSNVQTRIARFVKM